MVIIFLQTLANTIERALHIQVLDTFFEQEEASTRFRKRAHVDRSERSTTGGSARPSLGCKSFSTLLCAQPATLEWAGETQLEGAGAGGIQTWGQ